MIYMNVSQLIERPMIPANSDPGYEHAKAASSYRLEWFTVSRD